MKVLGPGTVTCEYCALDRLLRNLPPALTFLRFFELHDAAVLALAVDDAGQVVLRLHLPYAWDYGVSVELRISYAHARLMGITDDEREEIADGGDFIHGEKLDACADGRFVHRFWLSWPQGGAPGVDPEQPQFAIEFDDATMSLHAPGRLVDFGQPDAVAALQETVALLRQRAIGGGFDWWLDDLSRRLAGPSTLEEALAAMEEFKGKVVAIDDSRATVALDDGSERIVEVPDITSIEVGMPVAITDYGDGRTQVRVGPREWWGT
jgi:hypothetical protein